MSERTFEEVAVIVKHNYTVRILEYKESGIEFTEIIIYTGTEKACESANNFVFSFTVKGKGKEEKERIEKMKEREFDDFLSHMTGFIERKYRIFHK